MKPFKSTPLSLVKSPDPAICRIACPTCKSDTVTLLVQRAMAVTGPVDHGSKGPIAGSVLSILAVCPVGHHFIVRFGNHNGVGLTWVDVPDETEQKKMSESLQEQAKLETLNMPYPVQEENWEPAVKQFLYDEAEAEATHQCDSNKCPDCGGQIPQQKAPDMDGNGCCPAGINIEKAVSALVTGNSNIACLKCPILGCPGNPRNGGEDHNSDNVVLGCPWSVEYDAVLQGQEDDQTLLICSKCPHKSCGVHPQHENYVYNEAHYIPVDKKVVDKTVESVVKKAAVKPVVHLTSPVQSSTFAMSLSKTPSITPEDITTMKARLENLLASADITEGEQKWATRLLTIIQQPSAVFSIELQESIAKIKKIRKEIGMTEPPADVIPAPITPQSEPAIVDASSLVNAIKQIAKDAGQPAEQQAATRQMEIEQYVELLKMAIRSESSIEDVTEARKSNMSLVALLTYKRNTVPGSVSVALSTLLEKLSTAESLAKQFPKCLVVTDLLPKPMIAQKGTNSLNPHLTKKPDPKKKKP